MLYLGADSEGPKLGLMNTLAKADSPTKQVRAVEGFTQWAGATHNLVIMVAAEEARWL